MATEVIMPSLGLTMTEGKIVKWHKQVGDRVQSGEILFEVLTDKVTMEIEAQVSGVLLSILANEEDTVPVQAVIAYIGEEGEVVPDQGSARAPAAPAAALPGELVAPAPAVEEVQPVQATGAGRVKISPRARKLAHDHNVDYTHIKGSSEGGRILERDVLAYLEKPRRQQDEDYRSTPLARKMAAEKGVFIVDVARGDRQTRVKSADIAAYTGKAETLDEPFLEKPSQIRKIIAARMSESKFSSPHVYFNVEVDMTGAMKSRDEIKDATGLKLGFNDYIIKAVAKAIREFPAVNARYTDEGILRRGAIGVSLAVAVDEGLIVPVVKEPDLKTISEINHDTTRLVEAARSNKLTLQDLDGGTFTVSSLGMFGIDWFTAIINPGESAILAVGKITKQPVVVDDQVVIRPMMKMTLSVDHRLIDGSLAAQFLTKVQAFLENPLLLFL